VHGKPAPRYCFVLTTERAYVIMRHPVRLEVRTHIILSRGITIVVWLTHPKPTYMHSMCALGPSAELWSFVQFGQHAIANNNTA
jgi:hypothetical protein